MRRLLQSASGRSLFRLANSKHKTHCWAVTRKPHKCNEDCAYANGCIALGECLDVVIKGFCYNWRYVSLWGM